jgi:CBS domain-containing protein
VATPQEQLITLSQSDSALKCFQRLEVEPVSAAPIVDSKGCLVGTLSVTDVRELTGVPSKDLLLPVRSFLQNLPLHKKKLERSLWSSEWSATIKGTCAPTTSLADAIDLLLAQKIHRLWLVSKKSDVDNQVKPVGVVSMTDIIRYLFKLAQRSVRFNLP